MNDYENLECHRQGYDTLAGLNDKDPGAFICFPLIEGGQILTVGCTCRESKRNKSCVHFSALINWPGKLVKNLMGVQPVMITRQLRGTRFMKLLIDIPVVFEPTRHVVAVRIMMGPMDRPSL